MSWISSGSGCCCCSRWSACAPLSSIGFARKTPIDGSTAIVEQLQTPPEEYLRVGLGRLSAVPVAAARGFADARIATSNPAIPWFQLALAATTLSWKTTWIACCGNLRSVRAGAGAIRPVPSCSTTRSSLASRAIWRSIPCVCRAFSPLRDRCWSPPCRRHCSGRRWKNGLIWVWTMPVVAQHPDIDLGFNPKAYIVLAGFVEFFLAYFLLGGRFFGRLAATRAALHLCRGGLRFRQNRRGRTSDDHSVARRDHPSGRHSRSAISSPSRGWG